MTVDQFIERFQYDTAFRLAVVTDPIAVANTFNVSLSEDQYDAIINIAWDVAAAEVAVVEVAAVA